MAATDDGAKTGSTRNARYPKVSLQEAVDMMKTVGVHGRSHQKAAFASYLGHDTTNSGAFMTKMGALRDWGFVGGRGEEILLTESGYEIAHESDEDRVRTVLRAAFRSAKVFGDLYTDTDKGVPVRINDMASRAVLSHKVAPAAKKTFMRLFLDSAEYVGLARVEGDYVVLLDGAEQDELPSEGIEDRVTIGPKASGSGPVKVGDRDKAVVLRQVWPGGRAEVVLELRSNEPLQADAFVKLGEIVTAINALVATLEDSRDLGESASGGMSDDE